MNAKILLLALAGSLAATTLPANAQVYSQNIVGYVNVVTPANTQVACCNPLDLDGVNNITNVLANAPKGTQVQFWNGSGFTVVARALVGAGAWSANAATNFIPPGTGFFIKTPSNFTNTFVGNVIPASSGTNAMALTGSILSFVGSPLAVSGSITNAADQGVATLNLGSMPKGTQIQVWNGSGYTVYARALVGAGLWSGNPTINVGEGFFIKVGASTNWVQTLP